MAKHDFLTPKAISNRQKAKGLQKLRWFCQVCQKQCRDENGFKCHATSESHQRQMLIVANNPDKFLSGYSDMFEKAFLENLRRRHGTKRMRATHVYNEYISDKMHIHMNATQWTTLSGFVQYLGRTGQCVVDETEKGWYIQYIDRDPRTIARQEELAKKAKSELDHEERNRAFLNRQLKLATESNETLPSDQQTVEPTKLLRSNEDEKIKISLLKSTGKKNVLKDQQHDKSPDKNASKEELNIFNASLNDVKQGKDRHNSRKRLAVDALMEEDQRQKDKRKQSRYDNNILTNDRAPRKEHWIKEGLIVKVMNKEVGKGSYYKMKGVIQKVQEKFIATVKMIDNSDKLQLDQDDLETVIPKVGGKVMIVNGYGRGAIGIVESISVDKYCTSVYVDTGVLKGKTIHNIEYEDVCRIADTN